MLKTMSFPASNSSSRASCWKRISPYSETMPVWPTGPPAPSGQKLGHFCAFLSVESGPPVPWTGSFRGGMLEWFWERGHRLRRWCSDGVGPHRQICSDDRECSPKRRDVGIPRRRQHCDLSCSQRQEAAVFQPKRTRPEPARCPAPHESGSHGAHSVGSVAPAIAASLAFAWVHFCHPP
jgi:hypothetical protein